MKTNELQPSTWKSNISTNLTGVDAALTIWAGHFSKDEMSGLGRFYLSKPGEIKPSDFSSTTKEEKSGVLHWLLDKLTVVSWTRLFLGWIMELSLRLQSKAGYRIHWVTVFPKPGSKMPPDNVIEITHLNSGHPIQRFALRGYSNR